MDSASSWYTCFYWQVYLEIYMKKSFVFVLVQFVSIAILAVIGEVATKNMWLVALQGAGVFLGLWALAVFHFRVSIFPEVSLGARLITVGPYRYIRHPMYTAVLLVTLAWVLALPTGGAFFMWIILCIDLIIKLHYEERMLMRTFARYASYMRISKRLLPFVY